MRPLGAGEILDRAVTLFVRTFVPVLMVIAIPYVPYLVLQTLVFGSTLQHMTQTLAPAAPGTLPRILPGDLGAYFSTLLLSIVVLLFVQTAVFVTLEGAYRGEAVPLAAAYRQALRRFWNQLGAAILFYLIVLAAVIIVMLAGTLVVLAGVGLHINGPLAILALIIIGIVCFAAVFGASIMIYLAFGLSSLSIALGRNGAIGALTLALKTVFGRAQRKRCFIAGLIALALIFGVEVLAAILSGLLGLVVKSYQLQVAMGGVLGVLAAGFISAYIVVFAYDLKVRGQGFDLELALNAAEPLAQA